MMKVGYTRARAYELYDDGPNIGPLVKMRQDLARGAPTEIEMYLKRVHGSLNAHEMKKRLKEGLCDPDKKHSACLNHNLRFN